MFVFAKSCSFDHDTLQRIARDAFANELHKTFAKELQNRLHTFAIEQYLLKSSWRNHLARAITCGAMATIKERVQAAKQVMDAIVHKYLQNPQAQLLDLKAEGDAELERVGLAQSLQIHPSKTLVHPRNRGTGMLDIPRVPQQVGDISDVAFSWHEVAQACAVRMPPNGSDARRDIEAANANLVTRSGGSLGPVLADDAEVMVTGCNHNSAGLKAINANARCNIPQISEGGFYSKAKIIGRCPSYAKPLARGLRHFVYNLGSRG